MLLAFAHIHGEAGTPTLAIWSAVVGRNGPVLCVCVYVCMRGELFPSCKMTLVSLLSFDTTPSPHRRINAPSLLLAFAHIHGEAGTPALGIWSAMAGRNGQTLFLCAEGVHVFQSCKMTLVLPHSTPPRLRTGESINAPSLLLAFAHIHGEAGTPTLAIWSAVVGRNGPACVHDEG